MNFDWEEALGDIFERRLVCPRCSQEQDTLVVGYSRKPAPNGYAPRHRDCAAGDECEARKLITLCSDCAQLERLRGEPQDAAQMLETYILDCRRDLDGSLDYVAEDWRDDFELTDEHLDDRLEVMDPEAFEEEGARRRRLEEEYLRYHREFRERKRRIPSAGWRNEYVEEIRALGYDTLLGD
jgi:hypothetical protein